MDRISRARRGCTQSQRGVASVGIAFLILFLIAAALATTFNVTGSVVRDASATDQRLQALYLAESGLERAAGLFMDSSSACTLVGLSPGGVAGPVPVTSGATNIGSFTVVSATYDNTSGGCLVRVSGTPANGQVVRTIEGNILPTASSTSVSKGSTTFKNNVPAGSDIMVVMVIWTTSTANTDVSVQYGGKSLTKACGSCAPATSQQYGSQYSLSEIFYLLDPPTGSGTGTVTLTSGTANFSVGVLNLSGVDHTTPIAYHKESSGLKENTFTYGLSVPASVGSVVVDAVGRDNGGKLQATGCPRSPLWNTGANGNSGAGSFCEATSTSVAMTWDMNGGKKVDYAQSIAVVNADPSGGSGGRVRQSGSVGGIQNWREVFVPPS